MSHTKLASWALVLLLTACAGQVRDDDSARTVWEQRRQALQQLDRFTLDGRIAAGGPFAAQGNVHWRQAPADFDLRISGPFGAGTILLTGTLDEVTVRTREESFTTLEPERSLRERLGWTFPVTHLRWWVLGVPAPDSEADVALDDAGNAEKLVQNGWELRYADYREVAGFTLPRRLEALQGDIRIRLIVDGWSELPELPPRS